MALYKWTCRECRTSSRGLFLTRPKDLTCHKCQGKVEFVTSSTSTTKEVIDNGFMYKPIERDPNVEKQLQERTELAEGKDDSLV